MSCLDGLARDADIFELASELAALHPSDDTFPGEVLLHAAARTRWTGAGASRADPLPLERLREQFLPELTFRGRENKKFQYAVLVTAAVHGGTEPDLLDEASWRQTDDFWQFALFAAVACIRATASRARVPAPQACQELRRHDEDNPISARDNSTAPAPTTASATTQRLPPLWSTRCAIAGYSRLTLGLARHGTGEHLPRFCAAAWPD